MNVKAVTKVTGAISAIVLSVFVMEGGFSDHPSDPGGATMYGITERVARSNGYTGKMSELPKELAADIYSKEYVYAPGLHKVIEVMPAVGHKLVDAGVNLGTKQEIIYFQRALNSLNGGKIPDIKEDGSIGPATLSALTQLETRLGTKKTCTLLIRLLDGQQAVHYMELKRLRVFTVGWVDHRIGNVTCDNTY